MKAQKYHIQTNIPMPCRSNNIAEILKKMKKGHSVLISKREISSWRKAGKILKVALVTESYSKGKIRVWRVS